MLDQYRFQDARPDAQLAEEKQHSSPGRDRIIDVTQSSRVAYDLGETTSYSRNARQAQPVLSADAVNETYDRRGRSVRFVSRKGLNVDSYV